MSLAVIIGAVGEILATVPDVGTKIHPYRRWGADDATFRELFVDDGQLLGWEITREGPSEAIDYVGATLDTHLIVIRGYMALKDSENTEKTFQDLIEAIRDAFNSNRRLRSDGTSRAHDSDKIRVRVVDHRMLSGVLVHYTELVLRVTEMVTP